MLEKTIEYKENNIKICITINGSVVIRENYNAGRFDDPYIREVSHLFECFINSERVFVECGNNYDISASIIEESFIRKSKEMIDSGRINKKVDDDIEKKLRDRGYS
jgi:hypothetical protein